jgi:hypothetical protein
MILGILTGKLSISLLAEAGEETAGPGMAAAVLADIVVQLQENLADKTHPLNHL